MMKYLKLIIVALFLLSMVHIVSAMGLATKEAWVKLDYRPNLEFAQSYRIITTSEHTQDYRLYVTGDLAEYVTLEPSDYLKDVAPGDGPSFTAILKLPPGLDEKVSPGIHQIRIGAQETSGAGGAIGVLTGIEGIIDVKFLQPGKYLEATLNINDVEVNKPANIKVSVYNGGREDIKRVKAMIEVYDYEDNQVATLYTEEKSLKSNVRDVLNAKLNTEGLKSGEYRAIATVYYDGEELKTNEDRFRIGSLEIWITDYTKEVPSGKIYPFDVEIESRWNNNIPNVYAVVKVGKRTFQTPSITLAPWETKTMTGYFDTTNMKVGEYDTEILVHDGDNLAKEIGKVNITEPEIMLAPLVTPTTILLIIIIVLLVIADIIYLAYSKKRKTYKDELEMLKMQMKLKPKGKSKK